MSETVGSLEVTSDTFADGETVPNSMVHSSLGGGNTSPHLSWSAGPPGTKSYAITLYDPHAPTTVGWWHWLLFDIDPTILSLDEGAGTVGKHPAGSVHGFTDFGAPGYGGMAPPPGDPPHHYQINVYALDKKLGLNEAATGAYVMFALRDSVLAHGKITGHYGR
jgi:hypothetical protein